MTHDLVSLLSQSGLAVVFANVLVEQISLPVPALPTLVVAGALAAEGKLSMPLLFVVALVACSLADSAWYIAGRRFGNRVMKMLCRISLTPDSCVSETQARFERWGVTALVIAKFVPALATIAPPLAGATRIGWPRFSVLQLFGRDPLDRRGALTRSKTFRATARSSSTARARTRRPRRKSPRF